MYFPTSFVLAVIPLFFGSVLAAGADDTSLTINPNAIATGFEQDGQQTPVAGQVPSRTSKNNFINFCATVPQLPLTCGQQVVTGSCNPAPMGDIPPKAKMPSCKFQFPKNGDTSLTEGQSFTIALKISNLATGNFVNAQSNYFSAPQQLDGSKTILGHSHVVVEKLDSFQSTTPSNPTVFSFFKGLNGAADGNGVLTATVPSGLPAGQYKVSSINTASNHQPALVPVAQHGSLDDVVYFTVNAAGAAAAKAGKRDSYTRSAPPRRSYRANLAREVY